MSKTNIFIRLGLDIERFSKSERAAQAKAEQITTMAKNLLASPEALTVEAIFPEAANAAPMVNALVNKLCVLLKSPVIADDLDMVSATLGRYGALLTAEFDNHAHKTIGDYVVIFENLYNGK